MTEETTEAVEQPSEGVSQSAPTSWEFTSPPTVEEVRAKLETVGPWWGVKPVDFIDYVQPLSQQKNFKQRKTDPNDYRTVWTLYFTVAGRLAMLNRAAEDNDWMVELYPEPDVPEGNPPGFVIADGERYVYREFCEIGVTENDGIRLLGKRAGMAWVPATGGSGAVSTNRFEKCETSARGRSIAAWGFGVLPGSGVASLEEMLGAAENTVTGRDRNRQEPQEPSYAKKSPEEMQAELRAALAEYQDITDLTDADMDQRMTEYTEKTFNRKIERLPNGAYDLQRLLPGELHIFTVRIKGEILKMKSL